MRKSFGSIILLLAAAATNAWTIQNHQSFARKSALSMNVGNVDTRPNIKVGVIGM